MISILNFAVGPVMMDEETLKIGSEQLPYFRTNEFSEMMLQNEMILKKCIGAPEESRVIFLTGSGSAAMEASVINFFDSSDRLLVVNGGSFGKRFIEICQVYGLRFEEIRLDYGQPLEKKHLMPYEGGGYTGLLINVLETSTGVLYDMNLVGDFCRRNNLFLVADAISSFLADEYNMLQFGINATILSSQKGLALPPGMSFIAADSKALKRIESNQVKSLYFNFKSYLEDGSRGQTPYTPAVGVLIQLRDRLKKIDEAGVDSIVGYISSIAEDFRRKIKGLPFEIASTSLSNALTPLRPLGKMPADEIFKYLKDKYDIFVCPNGGQLSKILFRVGHLGAVTVNDNSVLTDALFDMNERGVL